MRAFDLNRRWKGRGRWPKKRRVQSTPQESAIEGREKALHPQPEHTWAWLYVDLLAGPSGHKIMLYQGDSPPYGALWISHITGLRDLAIG